MAIIYDEKAQTFTIHTRLTTYQMHVGRFGVLEHLYYGRRIDDCNLDYLIRQSDVGFSPNFYESAPDRTYSLDFVPQEYPGCGVGDFRVPSIELVQADGSFAADFRYESHDICQKLYQIPGLPAIYDENEGGETLKICLKDAASDLRLELYYGVLEEKDMIARAACLVNISNQTVSIQKIHSACLDFAFGDWEMLHFYGRHCMERMAERVKLAHGVTAIESRRGTSSHQHNPGAILCAPDATETSGECCGLLLLYSGEFAIEAECDQMDQVRVTLGLGGNDFTWQLEPGERFYTPQALLSFSDRGLEHLSHNYHDTIRHNICRGAYKLARRPILINNWEATYFDFDEEKILAIAKQAAELGIEMMVLDDGWFGARDGDEAGLGDWSVNYAKLPHGLSGLSEKIHALGMKFGLWFEPEMVNEDSDLYRAHPDWAFQIPGRKPARGRFQLVLDMGRKQVREYIFEQICKVLDQTKIDYIKWDFNRSICDVYARDLPKERQGEARHRFVLGVYELLEQLTARYPEILFEGCSGGGGRFDAGMLHYTPQIWCSDDTDAIERLAIQHGTSFFYPISAVGAHISASPNHQTGRKTPLNTRGIVAMAGTFGYELDLGKLSDCEKMLVREQTHRFGQFADLTQNGKYFRLTGTQGDFMAWEFAAKDGESALVNVVFTHVRANELGKCLRLRGLNPDAHYTLEWILDPQMEQRKAELDTKYENRILNGEALMNAGIVFPMFGGVYPAFQVWIKKVR